MTTTPMATIQSEFTLGTPLSPAMVGLRACADALVYHTVGGRELRPDDLAASVDDDGRKAADAVPERVGQFRLVHAVGEAEAGERDLAVLAVPEHSGRVRQHLDGDRTSVTLVHS